MATEQKDRHLTSADFNKALPKEVAEKYKVVNVGKRTTLAFYHTVFGKVNFRTMTIHRADQLYKMKFPYLEKVTNNSNSKSNTSKS